MKNTFYLIVIAVAVLMVSCGSNGGNSLSPEEEAMAKAAKNGILGNVGEEMLVRQAEKKKMKQLYKASREQMEEEAMDEAENAPSMDDMERIAKKYGQKWTDASEAVQAMEDDWKVWRKATVEQMKDQPLPMEIANGTPLKLVTPFTLKWFSDYSFDVVATFELTIPRPHITDHEHYYSKYYLPTVSALDENGNPVTEPQPIECTLIERYGDDLEAGTQLELTCTFTNDPIDKELNHRDKALTAKKLLISWEHPTDK